MGCRPRLTCPIAPQPPKFVSSSPMLPLMAWAKEGTASLMYVNERGEGERGRGREGGREGESK